MANSITGALGYLNELDRAYKATAKSGILNAPDAAVRRIKGSVTTFEVQKLTLVGLGNYSKTEGFPAGDVTLTWEPFTYTQDRGRQFTVDAVDLADAMLQFGTVGSEFMRLFEVPEIDAYRFAKIATTAGTDVADTLSTGTEWAAALNAAYVTLQEAEVDEGNMVLFITPTGLSAAQTQVQLSAVPSPVLKETSVIVVPQSRLVTAITTNAGATGDAGGWTKASGAEDINFILMDKAAVFADVKHQALRVFEPDVNQSLDAWLYQFRIVHECFVYDNAAAGIYVHTKDAVS